MARAGDGFHDGELTVIGRVSTASNVTLVCDIDANGDAPLRVVYKPVRGERPLWDFPDGTLAGREVASYLVSEALGWHVIPETILREGPFGPGMVQRWVTSVDNHTERGNRLDLVDLCPPGAVPDGFREVLRATDAAGEEVSLIHADDPRLQRMAVLDVLLNNADRKGGHALEGTDGQVYGVDHGICLHEQPKLRTVLWGWAGQPVPDGLVADVAAFAAELPGAPADALADHITDAEIDALAARAKELLDTPVMPLPRSSRPIPWPAF
ncbi:SCO1664 family protein [Nocardia puris]|uniref:Putative repeat protein (TIGR03843 family) n=1 Tax=Nocardia puris TaxID=208602 RepID=A0A366DVL1_9NOCA|nr:SCO1664 family protein [Nocardia puris]MBF6210125.1 SCO1664 family protein [Nocardia puris]MBF6368316.1 SCO1664 family protein [Nocardia puris]MBF6457966.1 SCO1664 family protein [Nocardia puris]RBO94126.1 putative repeat protein (TIGR03843 family) [Nocardia puris]